MKRKLVKHGEATMMISLPAKWLRENQLKKGDEIELLEEAGNIKILKDSSKIKEEIELEINSLEESSIRTIVTNAYRAGYDIIKVRFSNEKILKIIKEVVEKNILGFEITKKEGNFCLIESITEPSKEQFDNIFSKVFLNIEELFELTKKYLEGEKGDFEDLILKSLEYDNFCRRLILKNQEDKIVIFQWNFNSSLIHGAREIYHFLKYLEKIKIKSNKKELAFFNKVWETFQLLKEAYYKKDLVNLEKIHENEKNITYKEGYRFLTNSDPIIIHHLISINKYFYLCNSSLMGYIFETQKTKSIKTSLI